MSAIVKLQLNECIDSCFASVKKKTYKEWKNGQQFFPPMRRASVHESKILLHRQKKRVFSRRIRKPSTTSKNSRSCPHRAYPSACRDTVRDHSRWTSAATHMRATGLQHRLLRASAHRPHDPIRQHERGLGTSSRRTESVRRWPALLGFHKGWSRYRAECPALRSSPLPAIEPHRSDSASADRPQGGECA
jgi:hypothetical protein